MKPENSTQLIFITVLITAMLTGVFFWTAMKLTGTRPDPVSPSGGQAKATEEGKIIYWRAPMDPMEIYEAPGKSKMGMDLVPVYADEGAGESKDSERKIAYWKAPMDPTEIYEQPGKSKMGMDLVPVYEDELVGGVDIKINPIVEQNMGLKIEKARKGPLNHTIQTYGHITFDETRTGVVSSKIGGWIEKLYADYTGLFVEKGEPLYEIYSPSLLSSQQEYLSAFKNYQKNKSAMNKKIFESAGTRLGYFDIANEDIAAIEQSGQVKKSLKVRSAFTGFITRKNVIEGAFVKSGESLFTISDLSHVWVEAHIFEYEQNLVFQGQEVEMTLSYSPGKIYTGKISYIFPYLQPKTRDVILRIDFENTTGELKPDMFSQIKIKTGSKKTGISIPSEAVIYSGEKKIVFVSRGNGQYTPRQVQTGIHLENGRVEILSGLVPEDSVVVSGQFLLDSESRLKEAIHKMIESKSAPARTEEADEADSFFDDMESSDDFFKDMDKG